MAPFIIFLTFFNIICWIIFFIRFKKLFSTGKIVDNTREQLQKMIQDIDSQTDRDLYIIRESSKNLRTLMEDADKKMNQFSEATDRLRTMIAETEKVSKSKISLEPATVISENKPVQMKRKTLTNPQINSYIKNTKASKNYNSESAYEVRKDMQGDLFSEETGGTLLKDETTVTSDGAAYKEVPLIITNIYEDKPVDESAMPASDIRVPIVEYKKPTSLKEKVEELYKQGFKSDEIAQSLSCSITEVDFIIDML